MVQQSQVGLTLAAVLLASVLGCSGPEKYSPPPEHEQGPWAVTLNRGVYRYWLGMGPFHTSWLGPAAQIAAIGEDAPAVEQVSFMGKAPIFSFDVEHASGLKAHVRASPQDTGEVQNLGLIKLPKAGCMVGSVTSNDELLGQIQFDGTATAKEALKTGNERYLGTIDCKFGAIEIVDRYEEFERTEKSFTERLGMGLEGLLDFGPEPVTEYRWKGQTVATMDEGATSLVSFGSDVPVEAQVCIASAMAIRLAQIEMARQQQAAADLNSAARLAAP